MSMAATSPMHAGASWHEPMFFGIHYDLHAVANDTQLGQELTVEHLIERLSRVRPDWIQCDCKGHPGYTSWPTKVGSTLPGVVNDALRIHRDATRTLGIPLAVHYSGVWDTRAIELHPAWARVDEHGRPDGLRHTGEEWPPRPVMTCRLSGYDDELMIPQLLELIDTYDVDGFWVDGENWVSRPCWCERCRAKFTRRTEVEAIPTAPGQPSWAAWLAFHRDLFIEHVARYAHAVHARKSGCLVCSNWMYSARQPEAVRAPMDYLSGDYDWAWGANRAAIEGRVLDGRGLSWDLMAWMIIKTGRWDEDRPWTLKTATHLCQDAAEAVALGGAVMLYIQPQRTGWLAGWHQDLIAEVADFCRARKDACFRSKTVPQAAVLHLAGHYYAHNDPLFDNGLALQPVEGALHALLETHRSTDVLTEEDALRRMSAYSLVVVPEQTSLSRPLRAALEAYARGGGQVLMSGAHLSHEYSDLVGAKPDGDAVSGDVYLPARARVVPVAGSWQPVVPGTSTEAWVRRLSQQDPDKDGTEQIVVTRHALGRGAIVAVHGPVFQDYVIVHYPDLRAFIGDVVRRMGIEWLVELDAPARLEAVLRRKRGNLLVNLINRGAGKALSPARVVVEELPPIQDVVMRLRHAEQPTAVTIVPGGTQADWSYTDGLVTVRVPRVDIHTVIVVT